MKVKPLIVISFRQQIVITFVFGFFVLISGFAIYMTQVERNYLYKNTLDDTTSLAQSLAVSTRSWVLANDVVGLQEVISSVKSYPELSYAMVISNSGRVLAHTDKSKEGQFVSDELSLALLKSLPEIILMQENTSIVDISVPIMIENKLIGWVRVAVSRTRENINLKMQFLRNINFIILASSLSLLAALLVTKRLSSGIDSLIKVANEIQAGKFSARVNSVNNVSEIIILGNSLNQMLESLTQAQNEIKDLNENLEQKVKERTAELEASNKELESFSYSVSHDLRAPLRHISGYANLFIKNFSDNLPEKGKHYLTSIIESANQMGLLIDDLLQLSKTSRQELEYGKVDMNVIFLEVYENIKQYNKNRNVKWIISVLPTVNGDFNLLKLVWFNLLANALKFTQKKSLAIIEVGFKEDDKEFIFYISDNGVGFDTQYSNKLFGVFQRLHSNKEFKGTGIGLANVYRIINRHGGRTWADAEVNKGATFYFTIPKKNKL